MAASRDSPFCNPQLLSAPRSSGEQGLSLSGAGRSEDRSAEGGAGRAALVGRLLRGRTARLPGARPERAAKRQPLPCPAMRRPGLGAGQGRAGWRRPVRGGADFVSDPRPLGFPSPPAPSADRARPPGEVRCGTVLCGARPGPRGKEGARGGRCSSCPKLRWDADGRGALPGAGAAPPGPGSASIPRAGSELPGEPETPGAGSGPAPPAGSVSGAGAARTREAGRGACSGVPSQGSSPRRCAGSPGRVESGGAVRGLGRRAAAAAGACR